MQRLNTTSEILPVIVHNGYSLGWTSSSNDWFPSRQRYVVQTIFRLLQLTRHLRVVIYYIYKVVTVTASDLILRLIYDSNLVGGIVTNFLFTRL